MGSVRSAKNRNVGVVAAAAVSEGIVDHDDFFVPQVERDHGLQGGEEVHALLLLAADGREQAQRVSDP